MPEVPPPGGTSRRSLDRRLLAEVPRLKWDLAASVITGLVATAAVVVQALALAHLLASAMPGARPIGTASWFALLIAGIGARAAAALVGELLAAASASRVKAGLRHRLVSSVLARAPMARQTASGRPARGSPPAQAPCDRDPAGGGPGEVATLAGRGLDALDVYVGRCLPDMVLASLAPLALVCMVAALDWVSALVMVVVLALFPIFGALVGRATLKLAAARWSQVEKLGGQVGDLFQGLAVLKALARTDGQRERLTAANEVLRRSTSRVLKTAFLSALVLDTLASVCVALVAVPLGLRLLTGSVSLSSALAVLIVAPEVFLPLRRASAEFHESSEGLAAAARALEAIGAGEAGAAGATEPSSGARCVDSCRGHRHFLLPGRAKRAPSVPARVAAPSLASWPAAPDVHPALGPPRVELRDVTVTVPGRGRPILASASFSIAPQERVLLVGASGAGKSTIMSLLLGFLRPDSGAVLIGGAELAVSTADEWRSLICYLPEHPTLLTGTLADNLRLAAPNAADADLSLALARAGAGAWLSGLPQGLGTPIGEGGRPISAGERQRVALARVLLRPRPLYLLDEPTVHLDEATEAGVLASLGTALAGSSALIVSHRPALRRLADRVVRIEDGQLLELGGDRRAGEGAEVGAALGGASPEAAVAGARP